MEKHQCVCCQNNILTCRIVCVVCKDIELCLQCFACGVETGPHKKDHDYRVLDDSQFLVFPGADTWTAEEELCFLDAVEQYGFGNWEDVAKLMKSKGEQECKDHYYKYYVHGNIGKVTFSNERPNNVVDHTCPDGGPLSPSITVALPPLELSPLEQHQLGYMPLRDDYEREYDNDAESLVSSLSLNYDDEDIDTAFKLAQVDMYRQRWKNRQRVKRVARDYSLIKNACQNLGLPNSAVSTPKKYQQQAKKQRKKSKEEKELNDKLKPLARFHSSADHDKLVESLLKEKHLKNRIRELMRYRKNGATKLEGDVKNSLGARELATIHNNGLLTATEKKMCRSIGLKPASYITIKTCIIKDYLQRRQGIPVKIRYPSHLDKTHRRQILSFLSDNGWIGSFGNSRE